jgi:hypothetical protein
VRVSVAFAFVVRGAPIVSSRFDGFRATRST